MSAALKRKLTEEQYLEIERAAAFRSEFFDGEMFIMSGATEPHVAINTNVSAELHFKLKGGPCRVRSTDMRVKVKASGLYTYPDTIVLCEPSDYVDNRKDTITNPKVIIEVLSPSTESYERGEKFDHYKRIDTLQEYILIAQNKPHIDHYTRQDDSRWLLETHSGLDTEVVFHSLSVSLLLADIYSSVEFPDMNLRLHYPEDRR